MHTKKDYHKIAIDIKKGNTEKTRLNKSDRKIQAPAIEKFYYKFF